MTRVRGTGSRYNGKGYFVPPKESQDQVDHSGMRCRYFGHGVPWGASYTEEDIWMYKVGGLALQIPFSHTRTIEPRKPGYRFGGRVPQDCRHRVSIRRCFNRKHLSTDTNQYKNTEQQPKNTAQCFHSTAQHEAEAVKPAFLSIHQTSVPKLNCTNQSPNGRHGHRFPFVWMIGTQGLS